MNRHLTGSAAILLGVSCLLSGACSSASNARVDASLTHETDDTWATLEKTLDETYDSMFGLMAPIYLFYAQNERWPSSAEELLVLTRQLGLGFDPSQFSQLDLDELQDGSLQVRFQLAPPSHGGGEFVLAKPDFAEDDPAEITVHRPLVL
jgi:hypothetical protein